MAAVPPSTANRSTDSGGTAPPAISRTMYWRTICSLTVSMRGGTG
jgi:hypothetical protein